MTNAHPNDTIAAIATAPGEAGIAIVRVSGPEAFRIADLVFRCAGPPPSQRPAQTFVHGVVFEDGEHLDEALLLIMRAPHSYTGQDAIEIQGHGGSVPARRILQRVVTAGARVAEPGEFTRRAFLNGRIDLTQAEAVLDLIRARSDRAAKSALEQLEGTLSRRIDAVYDEVLRVAADVEASLDFPEDELPPAVLKEIEVRTRGAQQSLKELLATFNEGRILREGARVVIAGRPNAGKSTLLNELLGLDRAIVSHHPGTTRDTIEEQLVIDGLPIRLIDTAGLRDTECDVEKSGISRTINELKKADATIYVADVSAPPHADDIRQLDRLAPADSLLVLNKCDLGSVWPAEVSSLRTIRASLVTRVGLSEIRAALVDVLTQSGAWSALPHAAISERHRELLTKAAREVEEAVGIMGQGDQSLDLAADRLREALEQVGRITGRIYESEMLDSIFSRFCIGK